MTAFFFCGTQDGLRHPHLTELLLDGHARPARIEYPANVPMELVLPGCECSKCVLECGLQAVMDLTVMGIARFRKNENELNFFKSAGCTQETPWNVPFTRIPSHLSTRTRKPRARRVRRSQHLRELPI
jgi:hypothetical protein